MSQKLTKLLQITQKIKKILNGKKIFKFKFIKNKIINYLIK